MRQHFWLLCSRLQPFSVKIQPESIISACSAQFLMESFASFTFMAVVSV